MSNKNITGLEVAVIGMSGKFPQADNLEEFWGNIKNGIESIAVFSTEELRESGVSDVLLENPNYIKAYGVFENRAYFDSSFFGYSPKEAENMDPLIRLFHEVAWESLEDAGYDSISYKGAIGLYAGASSGFGWGAAKMLRDIMTQSEEIAMHMTDNTLLLSTRISHKLNLRGPSVTMFTACSTSLVAIHMACRSLLTGECNMALAGAGSVLSVEKTGYMYQEGMILSPDGHCRSFDEKAGGTLYGEGVGVVVLKRLKNAVADGDTIRCIIKASAVNNDGIAKASYTAPGKQRIADVIRTGLKLSRVAPESVGYIESHGTATALGDAIEIQALKEAFDSKQKGFCGIGSIKSNIGHLDVAAGIAGFIKTVLVLNHRQIPPSLHFETPNPTIDLIDSPFYVNSSLSPWKENGSDGSDDLPLQAGISSFGIGGTNAFIIIEGVAPPADKRAAPPAPAKAETAPQLLLLSARSDSALERVTENLVRYLRETPGVNLGDVAYTLQVGRRAFSRRRMLVCSTVTEAVEGLSSMEEGTGIVHTATVTAKDRAAEGDGEEKATETVTPAPESGPERAEWLTETGMAWLKGAAIDWDALYSGDAAGSKEKHRRIPLPTYPFERDYYWISSTNMSKLAEETPYQDPLTQRKEETDWFYIPSWERSEQPLFYDETGPDADDASDGDDRGVSPWLIFADEQGLGDAVAARLKQMGREVIIVRTDSSGIFSAVHPDDFMLDPSEDHHYERLFQQLRETGKLPRRILHLWSVTHAADIAETGIDMTPALNRGFYSLLNIAKAIGNDFNNVSQDPLQILAVSDNMQEVTGDEEVLCPQKAPLLGALKVIPLEYPGVLCRSVDIVLPQPGSGREAMFVHYLLSEFSAGFSQNTVAYRGNRRWTETFKPAPLHEPGKDWLKPNGVYLITGGMGGMGLAFARYLAESVQARLILVGRSADSTKEKHKDQLEQLETMGAAVMVAAANVADEESMRTVIREAEERFGSIDGIFHTAGIVDYGGMIRDRTRPLTEEALEPKIRGTLVLDRVFSGKEEKPAFLVLFSSIGNIVYGNRAGQAGYNAANEFLDAFAGYRMLRDATFSAPPVSGTGKPKRTRTITVNWSHWKAPGVVVASHDGGHEYDDALSPQEGVAALDRMMRSGFSRVAVSTYDLEAQMNRVNRRTEKETGAVPGTPKESTASSLYQRPQLSTVYLPPRDELEQSLAAVWREFFAIKEAGVHDNFFELGGDSLKAITIITEIHKQLDTRVPISELFQAPTIEGLAQYITTSGVTEAYTGIPPAEEREYYPMSSVQRRMYILQQSNLSNTGYNTPQVFDISGTLDLETLQRGFKGLVERHESFRTSFRLVNGETVQIISPTVDFELDVHHPETPERAEQLVDEFVRPFDLSTSPLIRVRLVKVEHRKYILMTDVHHIVIDGYSFPTMVHDFMMYYYHQPLPPPGIQYKDYSQWRNSGEQREALKKQETYWLKQFEGEIPVLNLPEDYPRPPIRSFEGRKTFFTVPLEATRGLKQIAVSRNATLFMALLSLFNILLAKLSNQEDIVVGTPIAGRTHADLHRVIGMMVNTLAIRTYPAAEKTFIQFLSEVGQNTLGAFENQDYLFEELVTRESLNIAKDASRNPIFETLFNLLNFGTRPNEGMEIDQLEEEDPELSVQRREREQAMAVFDLTVQGSENPGGVSFELTYRTKLFKPGTIARFIDYFQRVITTVIETPEIKIADIEVASPQEKRQLIDDFNNTGADFPENKTIHDLVADQVQRAPDAIALAGTDAAKTGEHMQLTYRQLDEQAAQLAGLLASKGVGPGTVAGFMLERCIEVAVAMVGILEAGAAFLPVDANLPGERIEYMLRDSNAVFCISDDWVKGENNAVHEVKSNPASLAYIIYTSGSTGRPKGTLLEHRGVASLNVYFRQVLKVSEHDRVLQFARPSFDASVWETFMALLNGASLYVVDNDIVADYDAFAGYLEKYGVTIATLPPPFLVYLDHARNYSLRTVITAGSETNFDLVEKWGDRIEYINAYGPTETTVCATSWSAVGKDWSGYRSVPIGSPILNTKVYILDKHDRLQPIGVPGEMCVSGVSLARGYLNNPELTAEKFDKDFKDCQDGRDLKKRIYRTGDLARWLEDGNIEFLGRIDLQVKVRGIRVELGEVEARLEIWEMVKEAVVTAAKDEAGQTYLCAYVIPDFDADDPDAEANTAAMRRYLAGKLPDYMIPAYFVTLHEMPLTASGKVDRTALPEPSFDADQEYVAPVDAVERRLVSIWGEILSVEKNKISTRAGFFELGGDSLKATFMISRIHQALEVQIPLAEIFNAPTIKELGEYIKNTALNERYVSIEPIEKKEYYPLSSAQKRMYILQQMDLKSTGYNMPFVLPLGKNVEKERLENTFKQLIQRHESLRTSFETIHDEPVQRVRDEVDFEMETIGRGAPPWSPLGGNQGSNQGSHGGLPLQPRWDYIRPFDLGRAPLVRSGLIKLPDDHYIWMVDIHHIVSDGTSHIVLTEDFISLYNNETLAPLRVHYKDFSQWQNRLFGSGVIDTQEEYWLGLFPGEIPRLNLPVDHKRPELFTYEGDHFRFTLDREDAVKFRTLGTMMGGTLYMNILAALNALFYKYTGQEDIIIGSGIAGRPHAELQEIIGMFVNTLAMRNRPRGEFTYEAFLKTVIANSIDAFENQDIQFEELVDKLDLERDTGRNPLFDVMMLVQNFNFGSSKGGVLAPATGNEETPAETRTVDFTNRTSKFDMSFFVMEAGDDVHIDIEYYTAIFKPETIARMVEHFREVVKQVSTNPAVLLEEVEIVTEREKEQVLYQFNDTESDFPADRAVIELFEEQSGKIPHCVAVVSGEDHVTYRFLDQRANQLGNYLCRYLYQEKGVTGEQLVGLLMDQGLFMIIAVMGILKAGAAYVPMAPSLPEERIRHMIDDSGMELLIGQKQYIKTLNRLQWECASLGTFLCIDSPNVRGEKEGETGAQMSGKLWDYVSETSVDEITGGGWSSSYTGEPMSGEEMNEFRENVLQKLEPLLHKEMRVLEIGAASGITMFHIAPKVGLYYGTDFSEAMIAKNRERVEAESHQNIKLRQMAAHDIHQLEEGDFDLVIINSVVQYFSGHNYLGTVIDRIMEMMRSKGRCYLFIGDIMDLELKEQLTGELVSFKRANPGKEYKTKTDWSEEFFISRPFLEDLAWDYPAIQDMEFSGKIHTIENELTKFRYDALISIGKSESNANKRPARHKHRHDLSHVKAFGIEKPVLGGPLGSLVYTIYTSGSTGVPKGVMVDQASVVNVLYSLQKEYPFTGPDVYLSKTSYVFDVSVSELFGWFLGGGRLAVLEQGAEREPRRIIDAVTRYRVSHINFVPSMFNLFTAALNRETIEAMSHLKYIFLAGEALMPGVVDAFRGLGGSTRLENIYGPTEGTIYASNYSLSGWSGGDSVPIGKPLSNVMLTILDKADRIQPVGIPGELCINGAGVARGYLNRPELTAQRFYKSFSGGPGGRLFKKAPLAAGGISAYRTGDLTRWLFDGNIEFFGRLDSQVKVRGFRVELGEIENRLLKEPLIREAVVIDKADSGGDRTLTAYIVPGASIEISELKASLSNHLPDYMIPSFITPVESIPLTAGGKVDRRALPEPEIVSGYGERYSAPRNEMERVLVNIWSEVLSVGREAVGLDVNFFDLGGHSLKATIVMSKIHKEFNAQVPLAEIFRSPTVRQLAAYLEEAVTDAFVSIPPVEKKEYYVLSPAQKRLYILQQLELGITAYNMPYLIPLAERVEKGKLEEAFRKLVARHESLRTSFHMIGEEPVQRVHDEAAFEIEFFGRGVPLWSPLNGNNSDSRNNSGSHGGQPLQTLRDFVRPFELAKAPLLRVELLEMEGRNPVLLLDMHHIITDGTSQDILASEFSRFYRGDELGGLAIQYKDYSEWQQGLGQRELIKGQETYWLQALSDEIPVLNLPTDYPRPEVQSFEGSVMGFRLTEKETRRLNELSDQSGVTLYMVILAVINVLLSKLSGQEDIIVGTPIAARRHADLEPVVGMFVNTLAMRNRPAGEKTFGDFLDQLKTQTLNAYENQEYPFEELVDGLTLTRDTGRNPLFDVMLNLLNQEAPVAVDAPGGLFSGDSQGGLELEQRTSKFDLNFAVFDSGRQLAFVIEYCTRLFSAGTIKKFTGYIKRIVHQLAEAKDLELPISSIEILSGVEKQRISELSSGVQEPVPPGLTMHLMFEEQAVRTPDHIAVVDTCPATMTYKELNRRSNQLAKQLRKRGVNRDSVVALMVERSVEMIVALLSILKAGGAYLPLDPQYPEDRKT
ncbi:MAG: amino acid adenylation domain-containing protein, partial [bacterium]|nr:amino acid adenylation domain-containing protein [bacterium]